YQLQTHKLNLQNYSAYNSDFVGLAYEFAIDKGKNIWIAAYDGGLITFNPDGINYTGYYSAPQFKISGKTFYDTNVNGNLDLGEYGLAYQRIECSTDSSVTFSNTTGNFALLKDTGNYDLTCLPSPGWNLSNFTSITNVQLDSTNVSNIDFGLYPNRTIRQAEIYLTSGGGRCFSQVDYWIDFSNTGTIPLAGKVVLEKDDSLLYISAFPIPDSVSGNRIVWNYILSPFVVAQIKVRLLNPLSLDTLMSTVSIEDNTGTLDSDTTYESILCSFDPNDKNCKPVGETDQHFVSVDDTLEYTIRFQNTGNDTAFNIMIVDTLSAFLDLSTFKMLGSSHAVNPQLKSDGRLTLYYDNINLLCEKVSEPESHGYFKYKIGIKNLWPVTGAIYNEASIYFDYNYPIVTNTTWHTVASSIDVSEPTERRQIIIFPVPAHNYVMINLEQMANNGILQIFDMSGILIEEMVVNKSSMKVNTERYPQGVLFIRYNDGINEYHTKFIILHN
ncbi:MAG TPA: T9SS type A sorting domain-containing protein, partial [Candidatus Cloacimonadota bacterium]|nr:T9SS type A sorting domain-containing protein [Candidatus Cloacimonadota bacterium]